MTIKALIDSEEKFFSKIIQTSEAIGPNEIETYGHETVGARRERVSIEVFRSTNGLIKHGSFKGLRLTENTWWGKSDLGAQVMGLYEKSILDFVFRNYSAQPCDTFVDIGAADGYYAIGMLFSGLAKNCVCFESSVVGREAIFENAKLNSINKSCLDVREHADQTSISALKWDALGNSLVLIDIEGGEFDLLDESSVFESLKRSTVLIEVHHWVSDFLSKYTQLLENASVHHEVNVLNPVAPNSNIDDLRALPDDNRMLLCSEGRPALMRFLCLKPKIF